MRDGIRLGICGTRHFSDVELFNEVLGEIITKYGKLWSVVAGGSPGADLMAEKWARDNGVVCEIYTTEWRSYVEGLGYRRPKDVVKHSDVILAFWNGHSVGTGMVVKLAKNSGKIVEIVDLSY